MVGITRSNVVVLTNKGLRDLISGSAVGTRGPASYMASSHWLQYLNLPTTSMQHVCLLAVFLDECNFAQLDDLF